MRGWLAVCDRCGETSDLASASWRCTACGSPWTLQGPEQQGTPRFTADDRSIWRYAALLPVPRPAAVSLGEGMTPLIAGYLAGHRVWFKLDFLLPTGSFKDRGAALLVSHARALGHRRIVVDSSGNAAAAFAGYAAAAGIECHVFAPAATSPGKLAQARAYGARVTLVEGTREDVAAAAERAAERDPESCYASHNWHPVFTEGTKTWLLETWEQLGHRFPAACFVPVGGGSLLVGAWRACAALPGPHPALVAAQPSACAPLVTALEDGREDVLPASPGTTLAEGARIAAPPRGRQMLAAVRGSGGWGVAVSEEALVDALQHLWRQGLYVEPTAALGAAAFVLSIGQRRPVPEGDIVIVLTGSGLKTSHVTVD